ncbi:hypothetical protein CYMTET_3331 [Cymbomonas tetramitiformis]|uniref:Reverse transcriptase Ty1/copia-type domain-containing protein n=1 Tax=Cymbomonas tetramitiformis TaxID=36881 RepID=A0AAE0H3D0_9CHLO|nr:hypothetical protein CYMTET_3331 [Cymbomonas tetramitiformis]
MKVESDVDPCLYNIYWMRGFVVIILSCVDDYLVATNSKRGYDDFEVMFHSAYAGQDLAVFHLVMGIGVPWGEKAAYLSQKEYISQMVEAYGLDDAEPASLPMTPGLTLEPASEGTDSSIPDRALCAQLQRVATCARSDIMAVVSVLSRFRTTYGPAHFTPLKQALRYLKGTDDYELVMRASPVLAGEEDAATATLPLRIYTDVDYAECSHDLRQRTSRAHLQASKLCGSAGEQDEQFIG